jgi:hypothetical protein
LPTSNLAFCAVSGSSISISRSSSSGAALDF